MNINQIIKTLSLVNKISFVVIVFLFSSCWSKKELTCKNLSVKGNDSNIELSLKDPAFEGVVLKTSHGSSILIKGGDYKSIILSTTSDGYKTIIIHYNETGNNYTLVIPELSIDDDLIKKIENSKNVVIKLEKDIEVGILKLDSLKHNLSNEIIGS